MGLELASDARNLLTSVLEQANQSSINQPNRVIHAISQYLPYLIAMVNSPFTLTFWMIIE
jgi:hypothetical protein